MVEQVSVRPLFSPESAEPPVLLGTPLGPPLVPAAVLADIYLDDERSLLTGESGRLLRDLAHVITSGQESRLQIEMHCDERGSSAYSLVVGQRRARVVREHFAAMGVAPARLTTTSYGKEKPLCGDSSGTCWEDNRRLEGVFEVLALSGSRNGCLARLRLVGGWGLSPELAALQRGALLRKLHLAEQKDRRGARGPGD